MTQQLSRFEDTLTYHLRTFLATHLTQSTLQKASFFISLLTCLFDASVVTFSIFTPQFIKRLHYDQIDVNVIAGAMNIGLYLTLPLLGYLSDAHGPILLALIGMVLCPAYVWAAHIFNAEESYVLMAFAFFLIGMGTSSAYFCSLLTCAKIYPDRKGLSISLPVAFYGLSSLMLSWIFNFPQFKDPANPAEISVDRVYYWLAAVYFISGVLNCLSSVVVTLEKEQIFSKLREEEEEEDIPQPDEPNENTSLLSLDFLEPQSHSARFRKFLKDPAMPIMYTALFFLAGPQELFISNLGSITQTVTNNYDDTTSISTQVAVFSLFSTVTRLLAGCLNDLFNSTAATLGMIMGAIGLTCVSFFLVAVDFTEFSTVSAFMGVCYGATFTLFPTFVATIWGVDMMGSTWGLFLSAPAFGSLLLGLFYAFEYDRYCTAKTAEVFTYYCLTFPFAVFAVCTVISGICITYCYRRYWAVSK